MKQNINIEAEKNELVLRNKAGDYAIIPAKFRKEVQDMIKDGCHGCVDALVDTLPVMEDYAQDGTLLPNNKTVKVNQNNEVKEYNTSSQEYRDLYNSGKLMNYDENTDTYIAAKPLEEVTVTAEAPQWLKDKREYEKNNPKKDYINKYLTPIARSLGNTETNYPKRLDDEYEQKSLDYVGEQLVKNKPQGKLSRAEWLNQMTDKEEEIIKRNPKYQSSLWADTKRGLASLVEQNPLQTFQNILNSSDYTNREKQEMLKDYIDHPVMSKLGDVAKILNPLTVPSKMIQSTYKDNYSFKDALKGKKNNAGIVEDIVTDPLNFVGAGLVGKLSKADKVIDATKAGSKLSNKIKINLSEKLSNLANKSKNISESLGHELNTLHKKLNPSYQKRAKKELEYANKWQEEWYNDPETTKRLQSLSDEFNAHRNNQIDEINKENKIIRENPDNLKLGYTQEELNDIFRDMPYITENHWEEIIRRINDKNYISTFQSKGAKLQKILKGEERTHEGNYGVSGHYLDKDYSGARQNLVDKYSPKIESTGIHEGNHGLTEGNQLIPNSEQEEMVKIFGQNKGIPVRNKKGGFNTYDEYLEDPTEIYARIMELREYMGVKPGELLSADKIEKLMQFGKNGNTPVDAYFFSKIQDKERFKKLFNRLPAIAPLLGVGYLQSQNQNKTEHKK
jgi:hypothetical protein